MSSAYRLHRRQRAAGPRCSPTLLATCPHLSRGAPSRADNGKPEPSVKRKSNIFDPSFAAST